MGWLIRFIHNRNLAAENIVTAYVRQCFVLSAPTEEVESLYARLGEAGLKLPVRSLLQNATRVLKDKGALAGEFKVEPARNARREINVDLTTDEGSRPAIAAAIRAMARKMKLPRPVGLKKAIILGGCVRINSRPFKVGDYCEFVKLISRTRPEEAAAPRNRGVLKIKSFLLLPFGSTGPYAQEHVLLEAVELSVQSYHDGIHVLDIADEWLEVNTKIVHVDSITFKLHRAPYPRAVDNRDAPENADEGDDVPATRFCCLRIWEVR